MLVLLVAVMMMMMMMTLEHSLLFVAAENENVVKVKRTFINVLDNATIEVLKECVDTNGDYTEIIVSSPPHNKVPLHLHTAYEEVVETLEGTVYFKVIVQDQDSTTALTKGDSPLSMDAHVSHVWWTEAEPVKFRTIFRPCFDGFHEGLEIVAHASVASKEQAASLKPGPFTKLRSTAVLGQMMATEVGGEGRMVKVINKVFRKLASTRTSQTLLKELRRQFLPHLQDDDDSKQQQQHSNSGTESSREEL